MRSTQHYEKKRVMAFVLNMTIKIVELTCSFGHPHSYLAICSGGQNPQRIYYKHYNA